MEARRGNLGAKHLPITARRWRYGVRTGAWRSKDDEGLELTCAVASPFAFMASITGLLDGVQDVDEGCQQGTVMTVYGPLQDACAWDP
jgi:hypothetical protein